MTNPVNGPVVVVLLIALVVLFLLWRSEARSAAAWRRKAREYRSGLTDPVYPPAVLDWIAEQRAGWPVELTGNVVPIRVERDHRVSTVRGADAVHTYPDEAAARRRHPAGRGLHSAGGEG